jgi:hypothetical protein
MDNSAVTLQQTDMLREIRDELRTARTMSSAGGGYGGGGGGGGGVPGRTFVQSQVMADRVISGNWGNLSWADPYRNQLKSSLTGDIMGAMGVTMAPSSMTQAEYRQLSSESWRHRVGNAMGSIVAPEHTARTNALAQDLYANSHRFIRFGDPGASIMGAGMSFNSSVHMAQQIQRSALNDLSMSQQDYTAVAMTGMKSGQLDHTRSMQEAIAEIRKLGKAASEVSRTLHISAEQAAQAMGQLRQVGILDVADQKRTLNKMNAAAQVAGMSFGDMMNIANPVMQLGAQIGVGAQGAALATGQTVARLRDLSRGGLISGAVMAQGGGVEGMSQRIMGAEMNYAASNAGYYSMLGGGTAQGADFYGSLRRGMAETYGRKGMQGYFDAEFHKTDVLNETMKNDPDAMNRGMVNNVSAQLRLMGYKSNTAEGAGGAAYMMLKRMTGDEAVARTLATENFTEKGVNARSAALWKTAEAEEVSKAKIKDDAWERENSYGGKWEKTKRSFSGFTQGVANDLSNTFTKDGIADTARNRELGLVGDTPGSIDNEAFLSPGSRTGGAASAAKEARAGRGGIRLKGDASFAFSAAGMVLGGTVGGLVGAAAGSAVLPGVGTYAGGAVGSAAGAGAGEWLGSHVDAILGISNDKEISGLRAMDYRTAAEGKTNVSADAEADINKYLRKDEAWKDFMKTGTFKAERSAAIKAGKLDAQGTAKFLQFAGERLGEMRRQGWEGSREEGMAVIAKQMGVEMAEGVEHGTSSDKKLKSDEVAKKTEMLSNRLYGGIDKDSVDISSNKTLNGQVELMNALESGDINKIADASVKFGDAIGTKNVNQFKKNYSALSKEEKEKMRTSAKELAGDSNQRNRDKMFKVAGSVASTILEGSDKKSKKLTDDMKALRAGDLSIEDLMNRKSDDETLKTLFAGDTSKTFKRAKDIHDMDAAEFEKSYLNGPDGAKAFRKKFGKANADLLESVAHDDRMSAAEKKKVLEGKMLTGQGLAGEKASQDKNKKEVIFESALAVLKALEERLKPR